MTTQMRAFKPLFTNDTVSAAVTATSAYLPFPKSPMGTRTVRIFNSGEATIFVDLVENPATAASDITSIPIPASLPTYFTVGNDKTGIAFLGNGVGNTIYITMGEGKS